MKMRENRKAAGLTSVVLVMLMGATGAGAGISLVQGFGLSGTARFAFSVSGAGDVNGDGFCDVIIGEPYHTATLSNEGRAHLFLGGAPVMDANVDLTFQGISPGQNFYFGVSVSSAGDVNGDGFGDVLIGERGYTPAPPQTSYGQAYIFYGGNPMNNAADVIMNGFAQTRHFGYCVSGAGDVNNDSYDDVVVGEYGYNSNTGRVCLFLGAASMPPLIPDDGANIVIIGETAGDCFGLSVADAGDVDGDGYADIIAGAYAWGAFNGRAYLFCGTAGTWPLLASGANVIFQEGTTNDFGISVASAGDVNGDGYGDVVAGASAFSNPTPNPGYAYVYFGGSSMNNVFDVGMAGETAGDFFGTCVSTSGDMDCDGYDDVVVGAPLYGSSTGRAYIYDGAAAMDGTADITLTGESAGDSFGCFVSGAGDVNSDGADECCIGASGHTSNAGKAYLYEMRVFAQVKSWLEGPYVFGGSMTTALNTAGSIPMASPYADTRTVASVPPGMTDWVSLELRASASGPPVCQQSFFLKSDGTVVDIDGVLAGLSMPGMVDGNYYLVLRHRNHLAVMSASAQALDTSIPSMYNFCTGVAQYHGGDAILLETGQYGLYAGDTNATGTVDANDRSAAWNDRNKTGYESADCNLSGTVDANDRSTAWNNRNKTTSVP